MCIYQYEKLYIGITIVKFISIYQHIDSYRTSLLQIYITESAEINDARKQVLILPSKNQALCELKHC